ncbi:MAG: TylF/MycF/NovP-related O-methyltransferase [Limnohabitans sp.]|jgi:Macrocin-O-methyltransferase (TylF)
MIQMPDFSTQAMYDAETDFHLMMNEERLAKFVVHWEAMKIASQVPGAIVECGVFKGTSFVRFALIRQLLGGNFSAKLIAFDVFSDEFPDTSFEQDKAQRAHWIETAGGSSISVDQLTATLERKGIANFDIVAGDATLTVPEYARQHQGLKISLLNVDIDFVEPTLAVLEHFYDRVSRGGVILLDNYAGEGTSGKSYHGDTYAVDKFFANRNVKINKFPFAARPAYIIKE